MDFQLGFFLIFLEKMLHFWVNFSKNGENGTFLDTVTSIFTFKICLKNAQEYIDSSDDFIFYEIFCSLNFFLYSECLKSLILSRIAK